MATRLDALRRRALGLQVVGFVLVALVIWLDEAIDLPRLLFHAQPSPFRPEEAGFELLLLAIVGGCSVLLTNALLRRLAYAESFLSFCPSCQRILRRSEWTSISDFFQEQQAEELRYGECPSCMEAAAQHRGGLCGADGECSFVTHFFQAKPPA
jgi:hypothetical protein